VKELQRQGNPNIVIALAGNKVDLASKRKIEVEEAQAYADENGILFMETSAKTAANVNELFVAIAKKLPKTPPTRPNSTRVNLAPPEDEQPNGKGAAGKGKGKQAPSGGCGCA